MIFLPVAGFEGQQVTPQISLDSGQFVKIHIILPLLLGLALLPFFQYTQIDLWLAKQFYNSSLHQWPYREHWLLQAVVHKSGRKAVYAMGVGMLICLLMSQRATSKLAPYRRELAFLVLAGISGPLLITYLKSHTHIYCPWDLRLFGGSKPYFHLFDGISNGLDIGHCFPAGHASLGYTLVNLYFFCLIVKPEYKFYGLTIGLVIGSVFGVGQQIRGAHFLSHDLFALAVCWFCSAGVFMAFFRQHLQQDQKNYLESAVATSASEGR
jgi:membrane-associated PAP2 superfamily phosphatase